jgi:hypothetical protein
MILRRLTTAFRKQDWFTVAVETLIVVFGVFIGLQVNNWSANSGDRAAEIGYLDALEDDFVYSVEKLEQLIARIEMQEEVRAELYAYSINPDATLSTAEFNRLLNIGLYQGSPLTVSNTTFDSLNNSGGISLIRSDKLTAGLQLLSASLAENVRNVQDETQILYLFSDPLLVENFPLGGVFQVQEGEGRRRIPWLKAIRPEMDIPAMARSVQFSNTVLYRSAFAQERLRSSRELKELYQEIQVLIDERQDELGLET